MEFDSISKKYLHISFSINKYKPGMVSSYWGPKKIREEYEAKPIEQKSLEQEINKLQSEIDNLDEGLRKKFLTAQLNSLKVTSCTEKTKYLKFIREVSGFNVDLVSEKTIESEYSAIKDFTKKIGLGTKDLRSAIKIPTTEISQKVSEIITDIKPNVSKILGYEDGENSIKILMVNDYPWIAFNKHTKPYHSEIMINTDQPVDEYKLKHIISHEIYGGHHTELCLKDKFLEQGFGEHSIINAFSPQTLISEGLAESSDYLFNLFTNDNLYKYYKMKESFGYLISNNMGVKYHNGKISKTKMMEEYKSYNLFEPGEIVTTVSFITNKIWGRYMPFYYQGKRLVLDGYKKATDKNKFIKDIYTKPVTPDYFSTAH